MKLQNSPNYMILRVVLGIQLSGEAWKDTGSIKTELGPKTDPYPKLIGDSTSYVASNGKVNENLLSLHESNLLKLM